MNIFITILAFAAGALCGALSAFYMGRPVNAGKPASYAKQFLPVIAAAVLLGVALRLIPGIGKLFLSVLLTAFCLVSAGTTMGLKGRDIKLLEMASVFRIPAASRMQYIDLPACRTILVRSAQIAGIVSALVGAQGLMIGSGQNIFLSQLAAGALNTVIAGAAGIFLKRKGGAA